MQKTLGDMLKGGHMTPGGGIGGGLPGAQKQPQSTKPTTLKEIIGIISDGMLGFAGAAPIYGPAKLRQQAEQEQFQQRWDLAESEGRRRMAEKLWERNNPTPTPLQRNFEWYKNSSPEDRALFDVYDPVTVSTWQGPVAVPRSSLARPEIGSIVPDPRKGGQPATPSVPQAGGVTYITPEQYQANVTALGKERADAHMLRNNIRIGGQ